MTVSLDDEYTLRLRTLALRRDVFERPPEQASSGLADELLELEVELAALEQRREAEAVGGADRDPMEIRGAASTGLSAEVAVHLTHIPTSIYHLFDPASQPLLTVEIRRYDTGRPRRLRVLSYVDGYSARAVDTVELAGAAPVEVPQLPTLFAERVAGLHELSAATLNVRVEDLAGEVELHRSVPIGLLARTAVPLWLRNRTTGQHTDLTRYLGAFVTPNAPEILTFLRSAAEHIPERRLVGYQGSASVEEQVRAVFEALSGREIRYVNSTVAFYPAEGSFHQRVRLPRESLADREANCIDGTVLVASLLEAISMNPAIVIVPAHAFVAWETGPRTGDWSYLETTMIGDGDFAAARARGEALARRYETRLRQTGAPGLFPRWPMRDLRLTPRIPPMA